VTVGLAQRVAMALSAAFLCFLGERSAWAAEAEIEAAPDTIVGSEPDEGGEGRFRFGLSVMGGPMMSAYEGGAGGLDLRLGYQMNNRAGFYAQPVGLLGAGASVDADSARASGLALAGAGLLLEVTPADFFYLAAGPEFLTGALGTASATASTISTATRVETGPFFSVAGRAGVALGRAKPNRRNAFTIGLDARVVFAPGGLAVLPLVALGFDAF
jgi:hypothetical protein